MVYNDGNSSKRGIDGGGVGGVSGKNIYKKRAELVLVSPSDLYSELNSISVDVSRLSFYSTSHCLPITFYLLFLRGL